MLEQSESLVEGGSGPKQVGLGAKLFLFGATLLSSLGCARQSPVNQSQPDPRPAYSTLTAGAQRDIESVKAEIDTRTALKTALNFEEPLSRFIKGYEQALGNGNPSSFISQSNPQIEDLRNQLTKASSALDQASTNPLFTEAQSKIVSLRDSSRRASEILSSGNGSPAWQIPVQDGKSEGHTILLGVQDQLKQLSLALEWDLVQLGPVARAPELIEMYTRFDRASKVVDVVLQGVKSQGVSWFNENSETVAQTRDALKDLDSYLDSKKDQDFFKSLRKELVLLDSTLSDFQKTIEDEAHISKFWDQPELKSSGGVLAGTELVKFLAALRDDVQAELSLVDIHSKDQSAVTTQQTSPTVIYRHGFSNTDMLLWYMVMRGNRDYGNTYYVPHVYNSYSNPSRLYGSSSYSSYQSASSTAYGVNKDSELELVAAKEEIARQKAEASARAEAERARSSSHNNGSSGFRGGFGSRPGSGVS